MCNDREPRAHFLPAREITTPADVEHLGWVGNHFSDHERFQAVETWVRAQTDREAQKRALSEMTKHGMGIDAPMTDDELDDYLQSE